MSLGRAWWRQLGRASGAAVLAPGAVIAALVVLSVAGGFGGLGSIGQAISGPVPPPATGGGGLPRSERATARLVALAAPGAGTSPRGVPRVGHGAVALSGSGTIAAPGATVRGVTPPRRPPSGPAPPSAHGAPAPGAPSTPVPTQPSPPKGPLPTAIDHVVSTTAGVTQKLPSPVGPAATHTVDQVGKTIDGIIGAPPPPRAAA